MMGVGGVTPGRDYLLVKIEVEEDLETEQPYEGIVVAVGNGTRAGRFKVGDRVAFQSARRMLLVSGMPGHRLIRTSQVAATLSKGE